MEGEGDEALLALALALDALKEGRACWCGGTEHTAACALAQAAFSDHVGTVHRFTSEVLARAAKAAQSRLLAKGAPVAARDAMDAIQNLDPEDVAAGAARRGPSFVAQVAASLLAGIGGNPAAAARIFIGALPQALHRFGAPLPAGTGLPLLREEEGLPGEAVEFDLDDVGPLPKEEDDRGP